MFTFKILQASVVVQLKSLIFFGALCGVGGHLVTDSIQVSSSRIKQSNRSPRSNCNVRRMKMGVIYCPKTSVNNYQHKLHRIP
jgi:hypothetical protein